MSKDVKFLCESRFTLGKAFYIPFTTELCTQLTAVGLWQAMSNKYTEDTFWLSDYAYLDVNRPYSNQATMQCFGYDGRYEHVYIEDNILVCRDAVVHFNLDTILNIPYCIINNSLFISKHNPQTPLEFLNDNLYQKSHDKYFSNFNEEIDILDCVEELTTLLKDTILQLEKDKVNKVVLNNEKYTCQFGTITSIKQYKELHEQYGKEL